MTIIDFINIFNLIKPTLDEVQGTDNSLSKDVLLEIYREYDLKIMSMDVYDDLLLDVLMNTNICKLSFSVFHFKIQIADNEKLKIGNIEEKGYLFYDKINYNVIFKGWDDINNIEVINQFEFVKFLLKYLELDFNRAFRKNMNMLYTKDIFLNPDSIRKFSVSEVLLKEIGINIADM